MGDCVQKPLPVQALYFPLEQLDRQSLGVLIYHGLVPDLLCSADKLEGA